MSRAVVVPPLRCCKTARCSLQQGAFEADNTVDLYDPTINTFAPAALLPKMNQTRVSATATLLPNGKSAYRRRRLCCLNTIELYTP